MSLQNDLNAVLKERRPLLETLSSGFIAQTRVLHALIIRDLMMRYGRQNIGFLWVILEPMILVSLVLVLWSYLHRSYEHGMTLIGFVFTGYMPITMYRHLTNCCVRMFRSNFYLLFHPGISLLDIYISRMSLEFISVSLAFCIVYSTLYTFGYLEPINSIGLLLFAWLCYALLSASIGLSLAIMTDYWESAERFVAPIQYILFPVSGTFFMVGWLPTPIQRFALFSPQINCNEMIRAGMFGDSLVTHYSLYYPLICTAVLMGINLYTLSKVRDNLKLT